MVTINSGLAWGVPVRPDLLGESLEALEQSLPAITTLRLCHRFGQGPAVLVTKLLVELVAVIEELIIEWRKTLAYEWSRLFRHYEGRCEPLEHGYWDEATPLWEQAYEAAVKDADDLPEKCRARECFGSYGSDECECGRMTRHEMNNMIGDGHDWFYDECAYLREEWEERINQRPNGEFQKYDKLMLQHFGLEVYLACTRPTYEKPLAWPGDVNRDRYYHGDTEEWKTTTCYVTLPRQAAGKHIYEMSQMEAGCGFADVECAHASLVLLPSLQDHHRKRFHRMLRMLKLEPYVHESQLTKTVSPLALAGKKEKLPSNGTLEDAAKTKKEGKSCPYIAEP